MLSFNRNYGLSTIIRWIFSWKTLAKKEDTHKMEIFWMAKRWHGWLVKRKKDINFLSFFYVKNIISMWMPPCLFVYCNCVRSSCAFIGNGTQYLSSLGVFFSGNIASYTLLEIWTMIYNFVLFFLLLLLLYALFWSEVAQILTGSCNYRFMSPIWNVS